MAQHAAMTQMLGSRYGAVRRAFPEGVASVRQLAACGIPERTTYRRCLDDGPWQRILPGIVLLSTGTPTRRQEVVAGLLLCGRNAMVSGLEACRRYGLKRGPTSLTAGCDVQILVPDTRQCRSAGFVQVERTKRLPRPFLRDGIPLAPLPRACTDAARRLRAVSDIVELLAEPVQRGMCTLTALGEEIEAGSRRGTAAPRRVLAAMSDGVRSAAEQAAKRLWTAAGLPEAWWNAEIRTPEGHLLGIADCWLDDVAMLWEIESTEWHLSPADHDRTVRRAAELTAAGVVYTATKPSRIHKAPAEVAELLRATYRQARARPRPPLIAIPVPRS